MSSSVEKPGISFGERLRLKRKNKKLSVEKVAAELKVSVSIIKALENQDVWSLPAKIYARGILSKYCALLRLPTKKSLKELEAFYGLRDEASKNSPSKGFIKRKKHCLFDFCAARKWAGLVVFFLILFYLLLKADAIFGKPKITVDYPQDNLIVSMKDVYAEGQVEGVFKNLRINGQRVAVSDKGEFKERIFLKSGENEIVFSANNFFNKTSEVRRKIINRE